MRRLVALTLLTALALPVATLAAEEGEGVSGISVADLRAKGDLEGAAVLAARIVDADPRDLAAHVVHQDLEIALGREKGLLRRYRDAARGEDASADQLYLYARLLSGAAAERQYREALKRDPRHFWSLCALGSRLTEAGKLRTARELLQKARDVRTDSGVPVNALGWLEEREGSVEEAEHLYREATRLTPDLSAPRVNLGLLLLAGGKTDEAVDVLTAAVGAAPSDPMPRLALGTAHLARGEPEDAVRLLESALGLVSNTVPTLNLLANAYLNLQQVDLAEKALDRALEKDPRHVTTLLNFAYLHLARSDTDAARRAAQRALRQNARSDEAHYLLGLCEERDGKPRKAEASYRKAARLAPENPTYLRALRALYGVQGRWGKAVALAEEVAERVGETPDALYELAMTYLGADRAKDAARTLDRVVDAEPDRLEAWLNLGVVCHEKLRDRDRAVVAYREYLRRGGQDPRVRKWLDEIQAR